MILFSRPIAIVLLLLPGLLSPSTGTSQITPVYRTHSPILINGNLGFTSANGVVAGNGTLSSPYIIRFWEVDLLGSTSNFGIDISNTTLPFVIRQVYVHSGKLNYGGIRFTRVTNATVENSTLTSDATGLQANSSSNLIILGNSLTSNSFDGVTILSSFNVTIAENTIQNNEATGVTIASQSSNLRVFHNKFADNKVQAYAEGANIWDNEYPSGGNYWSDYGGVDNCSGPMQNICGVPGRPMPDGIGDTPYIINSENIDRYPLVMNSSPQSTHPPDETALYAVLALIVVIAGLVLLRKQHRGSSIEAAAKSKQDFHSLVDRRAGGSRASC